MSCMSPTCSVMPGTAGKLRPAGIWNLILAEDTSGSFGTIHPGWSVLGRSETRGAGARGGVGHPLPCAQDGGAHCRAGALVGGSFSPRSDQSHAGDREANTDVSEEGVIVLGSGWGRGGGHTGHYIPPVSGPV